MVAITCVLAAAACTRDERRAPIASTESAFVHAESTYWHGQIDSARAEWNELLKRAEARHDSAAIGRALTRLASAAYRQSDYALAQRLSRRALTMPLRPADEFVPYNVLGLVAYDEGRHAEAVPLLDRAIAAARASHDRLNEAKATQNHALADTELGEFGVARERFIGARAVAREVGDTRLEGKCLANRAMLEIKAGDPLTAIALLDTARAVYRQSKYGPGEVNALGQLGVAYAAVGEPQRALATLDSALAQAREQQLPQEEASNLQLLAEQYRDAGDLTRALDYLARAQALNASLGLEDDRGTALRDAGEIYLALGQTSLARQHGLDALAVHQRSASLLEQLVDWLLLAHVAERERRSVDVDSSLRAARDIASRLATRDARDRVTLASAEIADRSATPRDVLAALDSWGTDVATTPAGDARALALRARAYRRLGMLDSAALIGQRAVHAVERVRGRYAFAALRTAYAWENADVYADLVMVLLRQGRVDDALAIADAARGRALLEHLIEARNAATRSLGAAREFVEGERQLRVIDELVRRLRVRAQRPPDERGGPADVEAEDLAARISRARGDYEALLDRATARDAEGVAMLGAAKVRVDSLRSALRADELLLEYFVTSDRVLVFAVARDRVRPIALEIGAEQLASRVRFARELFGRPNAQPAVANAVLGSLYASLVAPVRRAGVLEHATRLVIVPHGTLTYLPFAALRNPTDGHYLVEDFSIVYAPSAAAFSAERRTRPRDLVPNGGAVALAPFPDQLRATAAEAAGVARATGRGVVLQGSAASESAFRHALETSPLVHIATHAELNVQNPMFSQIALAPGPTSDRADDGRLEVHELLGMRVRSSLVFLSGCETGVGAAWSTTFRRGEDFATLAQAFLYAGARSVVATLWRIEDGAAAEFAGRFYDALRGRPAPEALADAQRAMLRDPHHAAPYDWAAYSLSGDDSPERIVAIDARGAATPGRRPSR
jgi:CHAT domain-containing protein